MLSRGLVGFYSNGITKCVYHRPNSELKNLGLHVVNFLVNADYAHMESRVKHYMQMADSEADINAVWYTIPATDLKYLIDNDPEEYEKLEIHQSGEVVHTWQEMRVYLRLKRIQFRGLGFYLKDIYILDIFG